MMVQLRQFSRVATKDSQPPVTLRTIEEHIDVPITVRSMMIKVLRIAELEL